MKTLILFAHPRFSASVAQRKFVAASRSVPGVTFHDLYAAYPDLLIDQHHEQQLLLAHDLIIFQHPFYWYSTPAIIKEWLDIVLDFGWAYGPGGDKLHGKFMMSAITAGGPESAYQTQGRNRFTVEHLLAPFNQTAYLCGMAWLKPFVKHESRRISVDDLERQTADWQSHLAGFASGSLDPMQHIAASYELPATFTAVHAQ